MPFNIPIALTWLRIAMIPLIVGLYYLPDAWTGSGWRDTAAALAFIVAAVTDLLDGWLARRWSQTSAFGAFLDPVADKLMVFAALHILLVVVRLDSLIVMVIIGLKITISAMPEWIAKIIDSSSVAVYWLGKLASAAQLVAIPCLLYLQPLDGVSKRIV